MAGGLFSAAAQIVSNLIPGPQEDVKPEWYDGVFSAFAGGFISGMVAGWCVFNPTLSSLSTVTQNILSNVAGTVAEEIASYWSNSKDLNKSNLKSTAKNITLSAISGGLVSNTIDLDRVFEKRVKQNYDVIAKRGVAILNSAVSSLVSFTKNIVSKVAVKKQSSNYKINTKSWWK